MQLNRVFLISVECVKWNLLVWKESVACKNVMKLKQLDLVLMEYMIMVSFVEVIFVVLCKDYIK